ncbi:MAG: proline--tRNA ligase [Acidobacteria bacterium]|nr:proline--tRNA ligase [Acidobacteriota bacterium]
MRWSQYFVYTLREDPSDADVISQKLMTRASMIKKLAAGIYTYLPLGLRSIHKLESIVREEMNRAGAVELSMPAIQPAEIWQESGRWFQYGKELLRIKDRHDRDFIFGPTHEEVITSVVRDSINSYRQLPVNLYQIQTKFRDEVRPRFGLMRGREFIMKDAYSFHTSMESLDDAYTAMRDAYNRIFKRCALDYVMVDADTGNIGGSASHEFHVMAKSGEDAIARCPKCSYGANTEKAVGTIADAGLGSDAAAPLTEVATPNMKSIEDVAKFLGVATSRVVKTLMYDTDLGPIMVLIRGDREVNEIKVKNYSGTQWVVMLTDDRFDEAVGGPAGFVGPVGAKKIRVIADKHLEGTTNWITGANKLDAHYTGATIGRDFEAPEFADVLLVREGDLCLRCGTAMEIHRGIEVGHIFKLGTKYSKAMNCVFLDEAGERQPMIMGCYGLGVGRTVASAIEQNHDADGIIWPIPIAPFEVMIVTAGQDENVRTTAAAIHDKLEAAGIDVMWDDRDERPGVKFKDADLVGFPVKITVGAKSLAEGNVEWSLRRDPKARNIGKPDEVVAKVVAMIEEARGTR